MAMRNTARRKARMRAPRTLSFLGAGLLAVTLAGLPTPASAHGVAMEPGSRSFLCYKDMIASGNQTPSNPACAAAVAQTGTTPLYNWFGVLDSNGGGRTKGYIPDGELCSGGHNGPYNFSSYNAARSDWPTTHLTAGSTTQVKYSNWAAHPGRFDVYITKDGWTPNQPLAWDDLTLTQTVSNPPQAGGAGSDGGNYYWNLQLPQGRTGKHMLFIHWIRSDSQENFYSCSDVEFDGGNGEVTGIRPGANLPGNDGGVVDPPTDDEPTTPGDDEPTTPGEEPTGECTATAAITSWNGGATVNITVENTSSGPVSDWMIHWLWPPNSGITISNSWGTTISSMGDMEMAGPAAWNGTISSNGSVTFGFNVTGSLTAMPEMDCIPG